MLSFHSSVARGEIPVATDAETIPPEVNWIDALRADAREIAFLERALGIGEIPVATDAETIPPEVNWIDALRADAREIAFLERALGIEVPSLESLSEIESSSRLHTEKDWLHLSIPMIHRPEGFMPGLTPLGFVLSKDLLLTVRSSL